MNDAILSTINAQTITADIINSNRGKSWRRFDSDCTTTKTPLAPDDVYVGKALIHRILTS